MKPKFYTAMKLCKLLGIPRATYWRYVKAGILPTLGDRQAGTVTIYSQEDLEAIRKALKDYGYVPGDRGRPKLGNERRHSGKYKK